MLKEEIGKMIDNKKIGETIQCYGEDKLGNVIMEIYYDGMRAGYDLAKYRLELLDRIPFGAADKYWKDKMEDIRGILDLCKQYENCE